MAAEKQTVKFYGANIETNFRLIEKVYEYAVTGNYTKLHEIAQEDIKACFHEERFSAELANCLYNVRRRLRRVHRPRLDALYKHFKCWLDVDYADPHKDPSEDTILAHFYPVELCAYWTWYDKAMPMFKSVLGVTGYKGPAAIYNSISALGSCASREKFQIDVIGEAFAAFVCAAHPSNNGGDYKRWDILCAYSALLPSFPESEVQYAEHANLPITAAERDHIKNAFRKLGADLPIGVFEYDRKWDDFQVVVTMAAEDHVAWLESKADDAKVNAVHAAFAKFEEIATQNNDAEAKDNALNALVAMVEDAGDIDQFWTQFLSDEKREDAGDYAEDTFVHSLILRRLDEFEQAADELDMLWAVYEVQCVTIDHVEPCMRSLIERYTLRYVADQIDISRQARNHGWCVMRLMRLILLRSVVEQFELVLIARSQNIKSDEKRASGILTPLIGIIAHVCDDDVIATASVKIMAALHVMSR